MADQADFPVRTMYRVLIISASGFYAWSTRALSARRMVNALLTERIRAIHSASDATYGHARVRAELREQDERVSHKRIARLMRAAGLRGVSRRRSFTVNTRRDPDRSPAPDLVKRQFVADSPNQLWVADMTSVSTWQGFNRYRCVELAGRSARTCVPNSRSAHWIWH